VTTEEKKFLKEVELSNNTDISFWKVNNIIIPAITIFLTIIVYAAFKHRHEQPWEFVAFVNLILNGSIPMIALNRLSGIGIYLFKYDKSKEKELGISDTYPLRTRMFFWLFFLVVSTAILYMYQVINNPFTSSWWLLVIFLLSITSVYTSITLAKNIFLLQEKMLENTFYDSVNEEAQKRKDHLENKYGK